MRRLAASILTLALLILSAVPAFGVVDQGKLNEIKALNQQMNNIKIQIIDKEVEAGIMDQTTAERIKNAMQKRHQKFEQDIEKGEFYGFGHKKGCCRKPFNAQKTE